jgi:catechol 2,3-dioxygenase-like lactoylglutathione lyase family enzyme
MIDHFEIKVVDFDGCRRFHETVLSALDIELKWSDDAAAGFGQVGKDKVVFLVEKFDRSVPSHIAFSASSEASVEKFHQKGVEGGFKCNGQPGLRTNYAPNYFAAFLLDPDGNNVEAVIYL